jgi:hypothetical protein
MSKPGKAEKWAARGERLSAALRENLKRRKEQARNRQSESRKAHETASLQSGPQSGTQDGAPGRESRNK